MKSLDLGFTVFEQELGFRPIVWARACVPSYPLLSLRGERPTSSLMWPQDINKCVEVWSMSHSHKRAFKSSAMCSLWKRFSCQVCRRDSTDCGHVFLLSPPERLYVFPCHWNYRPDHCMYGSNCKGAELEGVSVLHGNRGVYHDDKQPTFKALYEAVRDVSVFLLPFSRHVLTAWSSVGALVILFFQGQILSQ